MSRTKEREEIVFSWPKREKKSFAKVMLAVGAITLTVYTAVSVVLAWFAGEQPNEALTYSVFAYWGVEGGWTALLKINERKASQPPEEKGEKHP